MTLGVVPQYYVDVLVGLILSDGYLCLTSSRTNARLEFKQSISHFPYFWFVFNIMSPFCISLPYLCTMRLKGVKFFAVKFVSRSLPFFTELHAIFYPEGIKIVPDCIFDLLTPVALAHWIIGDGSVRRHGVILCTNSFSVIDTIRLINVLMIRYDLVCTLQIQIGQPLIYITAGSIPRLRSIVLPHMHPSMHYKVLNIKG